MAFERGPLTTEFVAYEENLDSFLVEGSSLLVLQPCNTTLPVEYTSQPYLQHPATAITETISALLGASLHPIIASRHG
jgi:hypothetical protein